MARCEICHGRGNFSFMLPMYLRAISIPCPVCKRKGEVPDKHAGPQETNSKERAQ
jgi:hypothetical protein